MKHLTRDDYASALQVLARAEAQADNFDRFAQAVVQSLSAFVASELTTLSVCDLMTGQCQVVGWPDARRGSDRMEGLDQDFFEAPLAWRHVLPRSTRGGDPLRVVNQYAMAVLLFRDCRTLASIVLNRRGLDFDAHDRARLALLRPHLAFLYLHALHARKAAGAPRDDAPQPSLQMPPDIRAPCLTQREADVMHWLACGKTDAEIAALLAISRRTVQKHLQHIYVKLGVETRTAAVMRALATCDHESRMKSVAIFVKSAASALSAFDSSY